MVQIVHDGDVVATHVAHPVGRATDFEHYPPEKIAFTMRNPTWCRGWPPRSDPACTQVIAEFMEVNAIHRLRAVQGVLGLRETVGDVRLEAACARAIAVGDPELPHRQGHPRRRHRTRRRSTAAARPRRPGDPARTGSVRHQPPPETD